MLDDELPVPASSELDDPETPVPRGTEELALPVPKGGVWLDDGVLLEPEARLELPVPNGAVSEPDEWLAEWDPVPRGTELGDVPGTRLLELEGVFPVPSGTEFDVVGMYAMIDELFDDCVTKTELGVVGNGGELDEVGATTTAELEPVPSGAEADAGPELGPGAP